MEEDNTEEIMESENLYLESPKAFHLEMPMYLEINLEDDVVAKKVFGCMKYSDTIDAYCIWCDKDSVFNTVERSYETYLANWMNVHDFVRVVHECTRNSNHKYYAYYLKARKVLLKIGQFPSTADFQIPQAAKYRKILGEEQYKELTRGVGLAAHGVGIGSFVYLRRIFENLIEEAHVNATKIGTFNEEEYSKARMDEKIQLLKNHLPEFLVENKSLYSILSIGIHSLKEEDCLKYFESVKIGIEQILDEKIEKIEKAIKAENARKAVQKVTGEVSK